MGWSSRLNRRVATTQATCRRASPLNRLADRITLRARECVVGRRRALDAGRGSPSGSLRGSPRARPWTRDPQGPRGRGARASRSSPRSLRARWTARSSTSRSAPSCTRSTSGSTMGTSTRSNRKSHSSPRGTLPVGHGRWRGIASQSPFGHERTTWRRASPLSRRASRDLVTAPSSAPRP